MVAIPATAIIRSSSARWCSRTARTVTRVGRPQVDQLGDGRVGGGSRDPHRRCRHVAYAHSMNRTRLSTTVDTEPLDSARRLNTGTTNAALVDEALRALLLRHRSAEVDASYAAYDEHPIDEPDEWGDLASWRRAAGAS